MTELQEIRSLARDFAAAELRPHTEAWDAAGTLGEDVVGKLAELGFFGMLVPESDGGMGFDAATWVSALEELAWGEPAAALLVMHSVLAADYLARFGTADARQAHLGGLAAGEAVGCIAFAEDGGELETRAERSGEGWRVTGSKQWVSNGDSAAVHLVLAAADDGPAVFVVPAGEGVAVQKRHSTLGFRPVSLVDVEYDVTVPDSARLGAGAAEAVEDDRLGRLSTAALAVGIAQAALDHALRYSGEREQFGRPIGSFEGIQRKLAEMATRTVAARGLVERAAADMDDAVFTAMAKLAAAECAMFVTTEAVQIYGGYGYMRDYPVEKLMRDAKATEIMHGPNEVQRVRIAEALRA
jgi:alkylation response protein AidB-like acyl-CoA dehydrogenase